MIRRVVKKVVEVLTRGVPASIDNEDDEAYMERAMAAGASLVKARGTRIDDPVYTDMEQARRALEQSDLPPDLQDGFLRFHRRFGGIQDHFGLNRVVWGIVHPQSEWDAPGEVIVERDDESPAIWHVNCADVHPSDTVTIDQDGRLYWCWQERFAHYDKYFRDRFDGAVS